MKKILIIFVIDLLILSGFSTIAIKNENNNIIRNTETISKIVNINEDYTHTAFLEIGNTQFCGGCDYWNFDVYELYSKGIYDFEYVNMIVFGPNGWNDILNLDAYDWYILFNISKFPTTIMDGGFRRLKYQPYTLPIYLDECGSRIVRDISANMTMKWLENATFKVDIIIENHEDIPYNGFIRAAITEITSRYDTVNNSKFNFGFLDYAFNKEIFISDRGIYTDSITWNGNNHEDNHGNNYGDIIPGNIQVVMGVYNNQNGFVDETVKAFLENPPNSPEIDGPNSGKKEVDYDFIISAIDPYNKSLFYYISWGDDSFEDWIGPFDSGEIVTISHNWSTNGKYIIKARTKTTHGLLGPWGEVEIKIPRNKTLPHYYLIRFFERFPSLKVFLQRLGI
jgi:hypothetical protein